MRENILNTVVGNRNNTNKHSTKKPPAADGGFTRAPPMSLLVPSLNKNFLSFSRFRYIDCAKCYLVEFHEAVPSRLRNFLASLAS